MPLAVCHNGYGIALYTATHNQIKPEMNPPDWLSLQIQTRFEQTFLDSNVKMSLLYERLCH